jgi:hypothetical protein
MRLVSGLSRDLDWESFDSGITPLVSIHCGAIYSFKQFAHQHAGISEADAVVLGAPTLAALDNVVTILEHMGLQTLIKIEFDEDAIAKAMLVLPLRGMLTYNLWIEPYPSDPEYEKIDECHELNYGIEVKRPRDCVEAELFSSAPSEADALQVLLKIVSRKPSKFQIHSNGVVRCWDFLQHARELQKYGAIHEAGVVAGKALEELLIPLTQLNHDDIKRDRLVLGKIISIVERQKKLHPSQTAILRGFAELRSDCAHAIISQPRPDHNLESEVDNFLNWLESYADWLK